jgi:hypothetical protein
MHVAVWRVARTTAAVAYHRMIQSLCHRTPLERQSQTRWSRAVQRVGI